MVRFSQLAFIRSGRFSRRGGFTLIEVVITVFILATIVSLTMPSLLGMRDQNNRLRCQANIRQIQSAKDAYALDHLGQGNIGGQLDRQAVFRSYFVEGGFYQQNKCPVTQDEYLGIYDIYTHSTCSECGTNEMGLP